MENTTKKYRIKLNPHITIYPVVALNPHITIYSEEKMVPISLVKKAFERYAFVGGSTRPYNKQELEQQWSEWFEQNVK